MKSDNEGSQGAVNSCDDALAVAVIGLYKTKLIRPKGFMPTHLCRKDP